MQLAQFLDFEAIRVDLATGNKRQLLNQLAQIAAARLSLDPSAIADAIGERERLGSTGFGGGVAIPHGKIAGIDRVYALVARLAAPMDYKAVDGQPVDLIFLLLSPADRTSHLKALSVVSRQLRSAGVTDRLRRARTAAEMYAAMTGE